jgi:Bacterial surface protein, Ig-like domain
MSRAHPDPRHAPVIQINGSNPATIHVGDTYADLGATITGPQADLNLGIKTFLNGTHASNIVIDTSSATTDTIDYVATDSSGVTSTSTRTVIIKAANAPSIIPTDDASTTATTTASSTQ